MKLLTKEQQMELENLMKKLEEIRTKEKYIVKQIRHIIYGIK